MGAASDADNPSRLRRVDECRVAVFGHSVNVDDTEVLEIVSEI